MKVILLRDVENLGKKGNTADVSDGYASNFLIPRNLAAQAGKKLLEQRESKKQQEQKSKIREEKAEGRLSKKLKGMTLEISAKAAEGGRLFGSITRQNLADELAKNGIMIGKEKIGLREPIRETGNYRVAVDLKGKNKAAIAVRVSGEK